MFHKGEETLHVKDENRDLLRLLPERILFLEIRLLNNQSLIAHREH